MSKTKTLRIVVVIKRTDKGIVHLSVAYPALPIFAVGQNYLAYVAITFHPPISRWFELSPFYLEEFHRELSQRLLHCAPMSHVFLENRLNSQAKLCPKVEQVVGLRTEELRQVELRHDIIPSPILWSPDGLVSLQFAFEITTSYEYEVPLVDVPEDPSLPNEEDFRECLQDGIRRVVISRFREVLWASRAIKVFLTYDEIRAVLSTGSPYFYLSNLIEDEKVFSITVHVGKGNFKVRVLPIREGYIPIYATFRQPIPFPSEEVTDGIQFLGKLATFLFFVPHEWTCEEPMDVPVRDIGAQLSELYLKVKDGVLRRFGEEWVVQVTVKEKLVK